MNDFEIQDEFVNPNTLIRGLYRPIFLWNEEFEEWLEKTFVLKRRGGGRPPGSGSWQVHDQQIVIKMHGLISSGLASSANDAARQLVKEARGSGTEESKQTRLRKAYRKVFGLEQN
jgi:hypothetical protein